MDDCSRYYAYRHPAAFNKIFKQKTKCFTGKGYRATKLRRPGNAGN